MPSRAMRAAFDMRERIHLLNASFASGAFLGGVAFPPSSSTDKRVAFQILFKKWRFPSMRLGASAMRMLLGGYVASVKRTASAPNAGNPAPICAADGYAFLKRVIASASGAPGIVFWTISLKSAPCTRSSGSITLPFTLLIFSPVSSTMRPERSTRRNGTSFVKCSPNMIMRATQKKRMS